MDGRDMLNEDIGLPIPIAPRVNLMAELRLMSIAADREWLYYETNLAAKRDVKGQEATDLHSMLDDEGNELISALMPTYDSHTSRAYTSGSIEAGRDLALPQSRAWTTGELAQYITRNKVSVNVVKNRVGRPRKDESISQQLTQRVEFTYEDDDDSFTAQALITQAA